MKSLLIAVTCLFLIAVGSAAGDVLLYDTFDDGDPATNTLGTGDSYYQDVWRGTLSEDASETTQHYAATGDWGNGGLISHDVFPVWNETGATFTWEIGQIYATGDAADARDYGLELNVLKSTHTHPGKSNAYWNHGGGLSVIIEAERGEADDDVTLTGRVNVYTDAKASQSMTGTLTAGRFGFDEYDGQSWTTVRSFVNEDGFVVQFGDDVTWSDMVEGFEAAGWQNAWSMSWADVNAIMEGIGVVDSANMGEVRLS
ncbi:MAG: hypothetical protein ACP5HU_04400 [Phycisphaerae bacterium]